MKNNIYLPIEISRRELDYKILLAAEMYDSEKRIFIGENNAIDQAIKFTKYGSFVGKSFITPYLLTDLTKINFLKNKKISILYIDEEGGIYAGDEKNWISILESKFDPSVLDKNDILTTWGDFQKNIYSKMKHNCTILTVGVPRFNLLQKYSSLIDKPINAPDNYILINTNFGFSLSAHGCSYFLNSKYQFMPDAKDDLDYKFGRWVDSNITFSYFIEMIHKLNLILESHKIVIRPHPSEDKNFYLKAFEHHKNILIDDSLSAINWMKFSDLIIHNGSTSALEGYFLNKPIINFIPHTNEKYMIKLPNIVGKTCKNIHEIMQEIDNILQKKGNPHCSIKTKNLDLEKMIANVDPSLDSFSMIVNLINKQLKTQKKVHLNIKLFKFYYNFFDQKRKLKNLTRKILFKEKHKLYISMKKKFEIYDKKNLTSKIDKAFALNNKSYKNIYFINENLLIIE